MSGADLSDYELTILANVEEFGCSTASVFDPDGDDPAFTYSIGLTKTVGQPEVIVFGLPLETMQFMVNETMRQCQKGNDLGDFTQLSGLLEGFDIIARTIPPHRIDREFFNSAMWFHEREYGRDLDRAVQLVWPSSATGLFPWDPDCHESVIAHQPALYELRLNS